MLDTSYYLEIAKKLRSFKSHELEGDWVRHIGATRNVYVSESHEWVIKIGLDTRLDYNKLEAKRYKMAVEKGLGKYFAETILIGEISSSSSNSVSIQRKYCIDENLTIDSFWHYLDKNYYLNKNFEGSEYECEEDERYREVEDLDSVEAVYAVFSGDRKVSELEDFLATEDINDLHEANFGYDEHGDPFITDFAGYY